MVRSECRRSPKSVFMSDPLNLFYLSFDVAQPSTNPDHNYILYECSFKRIFVHINRHRYLNKTNKIYIHAHDNNKTTEYGFIYSTWTDKPTIAHCQRVGVT